jgi:hypothetical protein
VLILGKFDYNDYSPTYLFIDRLKQAKKKLGNTFAKNTYIFFSIF